MNYIGSKYSLLNEIRSILDDCSVPMDGIALDPFAGTGAVAQMLKARGHIVYANDWQYYSYVTNAAFIEFNTLPSFQCLVHRDDYRDQIAAPSQTEITIYSNLSRNTVVMNAPAMRVLRYLAALPGESGPFYDAYCEGGTSKRLYYSRDNGMRIQSIRDRIELWLKEEAISEAEHSWLIACLIEAADRVANTASVYGAYLKHLKRTAQKPLQLVALEPVRSVHDASRHRAFCLDISALMLAINNTPTRLVYIDPPYNSRQYCSNYHLLETIARWDLDQFTARGVTGLRPQELQRSRYCLRSAALGEFTSLFASLNTQYVLFSYNNEGLLSEAELRGLFDRFCSDIVFRQFPFRQFRADTDNENRSYRTNSTREFLVLGTMKETKQLPLFELTDT